MLMFIIVSIKLRLVQEGKTWFGIATRKIDV